MRYNKFSVILAFMSLFHLSSHAEQVTKIQAGIAQQQVLEKTSITTIDGEVIEVERTKNGLIFKGYEDKIVLLEAFGHSCPPCKASIPGYNRLQKKYQKDMVVIAIEVWGSDDEGLKQYANKFGIHYKAVAKVNSGKMVAFMGKLTGWTPGIGVPYLMLFSRDGVLTKDVAPHGLQESYVDGLIQTLL